MWLFLHNSRLWPYITRQIREQKITKRNSNGSKGFQTEPTYDPEPADQQSIWQVLGFKLEAFKFKFNAEIEKYNSFALGCAQRVEHTLDQIFRHVNFFRFGVQTVKANQVYEMEELYCCCYTC